MFTQSQLVCLLVLTLKESNRLGGVINDFTDSLSNPPFWTECSWIEHYDNAKALLVVNQALLIIICAMNENEEVVKTLKDAIDSINVAEGILSSFNSSLGTENEDKSEIIPFYP